MTGLQVEDRTASKDRTASIGQDYRYSAELQVQHMTSGTVQYYRCTSGTADTLQDYYRT